MSGRELYDTQGVLSLCLAVVQRLTWREACKMAALTAADVRGERPTRRVGNAGSFTSETARQLTARRLQKEAR